VDGRWRLRPQTGNVENQRLDIHQNTRRPAQARIRGICDSPIGMTAAIVVLVL
jgi:hypothetical protein